MKKGSSTDYYLPIEVIYEILSWLPASRLLRFMCVSKSWYDLINDPKFIQLHLVRSVKGNSQWTFFHTSYSAEFKYRIVSFHSCNNYRVDTHVSQVPYPYPCRSPVSSLEVEGSCHGLVCCMYGYGSSHFNQNGYGPFTRFLIYNPTTRASKMLPKLQIGVDDTSWIIGFGYDSVSHDYKVLSLIELRRGKHRKLKMYSLNEDSWERVETCPWSFKKTPYFAAPSVNNVFHWLPPNGKEIDCFDVSTRRYSKMPLPEKLCERACVVTIYDDKLCVVSCSIDIWILNDYGNDKSWTQLFCNKYGWIRKSYEEIWVWGLRVACFKDESHNFILSCTPMGVHGSRETRWIYCDVYSEIANMIDTPTSLNNGLLALQPCVESLVPLH